MITVNLKGSIFHLFEMQGGSWRLEILEERRVEMQGLGEWRVWKKGGSARKEGLRERVCEKGGPERKEGLRERRA